MSSKKNKSPKQAYAETGTGDVAMDVETDQENKAAETIELQSAEPGDEANPDEEPAAEALNELGDDEKTDVVGNGDMDKRRFPRNNRVFDIAFIVFGSLAFMSVGWIIHLFAFLPWLPVATAGLGCILMVILDVRQRPAKEDDGDAPKEDVMGFEKEWQQDKDDVFYVQTDFANVSDNSWRFLKVTGQNRVLLKKDCGALSVECRTFEKYRDYKGYEVGGGIGAWLAIIIIIFWTSIKPPIGDSDIAITVLVCGMILIGMVCLGCLMEEALRRNRVLAPLYDIWSCSESLSLWDITSVSRCTVGWRHTVMNGLLGGNCTIFQRLMILTFKLCMLAFYALGVLFGLLWLNGALICFILCFVLLGLMFEFSIWKSNSFLAADQLLVVIMSLDWVLVLLLALTMWFVSVGVANLCSCCCKDGVQVGSILLPKVSAEERIDGKRQTTLFTLLAVALAFAVASASMITFVFDDVYQWSRYMLPETKAKASLRIINAQWCTNYNDEGFYDPEREFVKLREMARLRASELENNQTAAPTTDMPSQAPTTLEPTVYPTITPDNTAGPTQAGVLHGEWPYGAGPEVFCADGRNFLIVFSLIALCISWYCLLIAAYLWHAWDDLPFGLGFYRAPEWDRYSVVKLGLRNQSSFSLPTWIILDDESAIKLQLFLNQTLPYYKMHQFIPHQFFSRFKYNDFANVGAPKGKGGGFNPEAY